MYNKTSENNINPNDLIDIINEINTINNRILICLDDSKTSIENVKQNYQNKKHITKKLIQRISILLSTLVLFSSIGITTLKSTNKKASLHTRYDYEVSQTTYNIDGTISVNTTKSKVNALPNLEDKVYIKNITNENNYTSVSLYDVTLLNYENISDYFGYDLSNIKPVIEDKISLVFSNTKEVIRVTNKASINNTSKNIFYITRIFLALMVIGVLLVQDISSYNYLNSEESLLLYGQYKKIIKLFKNMNLYYITIEEYIVLHKEFIKILRLIKQNKELNDIFIKNYNSISNKLSDPSLLLEELKMVNDNLNIDEISNDITNVLKMLTKIK